MMGKIGLAILLMFGPVTAAAGQEGGADILRDHLYSGRLAEGLVALEALPESDTEAAFGVGLLTLFTGIENLVQPLYAHGFDPERGIAVSPFFRNGGGTRRGKGARAADL
ncbi:hypothetical protein [Pelagibacterium sp.]|uniref:hypothetical protein n=1 Tax=Pelagibacterium sp. TaxID=1967288 RepID=UPI003BAB8458